MSNGSHVIAPRHRSWLRATTPLTRVEKTAFVVLLLAAVALSVIAMVTDDGSDSTGGLFELVVTALFALYLWSAAAGTASLGAALVLSFPAGLSHPTFLAFADAKTNPDAITYEQEQDLRAYVAAAASPQVKPASILLETDGQGVARQFGGQCVDRLQRAGRVVLAHQHVDQRQVGRAAADLLACKLDVIAVHKCSYLIDRLGAVDFLLQVIGQVACSQV